MSAERHVLIIPLEEVQAHFEVNTRQDVKIVAPEMLSSQLFEILKTKGRAVKKELPLESDNWKHTDQNQPNLVVESASFHSTKPESKGEFSIAFANQKAEQDSHYHPNHSEIYFSEHPFEANYRVIGETKTHSVRLNQGGVIVFSPNVVHKVKFEGLTLIVEFPSVVGDKVIEEV